MQKSFGHGRSFSELLFKEAVVVRSSRFGDTDIWDWLRFWFNCFFTGTRTAWQRPGGAPVQCVFCGRCTDLPNPVEAENGRDDLSHIRVCIAVTMTAFKLGFIPDCDHGWHQHMSWGALAGEEWFWTL